MGLHSGRPVQLTLHPARANSGIVFRGTGVDGVEIPARPAYVSSTAQATTLARGEFCVSTVEHLMAALYASDIDNVGVEVDGPEVPVMDGSAESLVRLIRSAGVFLQQEPRRVLRVERVVEVREGGRWIRVSPGSGLRISYAVDFDHPAIRRQELSIPRMAPEVFRRELARARTFGFLDDVHRLWRDGLARGGSLGNTVVLDAERVLNPEGLRWPDEFVRHKVLDLLGDLALLGMQIEGHVEVECGGHALHQALVVTLLRQRDAWRVQGEDVGFPHDLDLLPAGPS
jgi:UDP-3-O-[3-hydroxymyristoyl] N-acetylglucosamine deacetylase